MTLRSILKDFISHVETLEKRRLLGDNLYDREFQKLKQLTDRLKNDPNHTCKTGLLEFNRKKNRYKDILPYDHTRVVLYEINDDPHSDYINASYIKGSSGSMAYIAAQGPLPHTVNDFWRMVWQCEVQVVVMACNEREGGKTKCDYYWPPLGEKKLYHDIMIETVKTKPICEDFLVRTWKVIRGNEQRTVCQFHYMTWPDHGIPTSVKPILQMIRLIRNCQATETIPVLVHCSAGCGRTGTFCAIDQVWGLLRSGKLQSMFSLYEMVSDMRHQRVAMVQTKEQYMLVHRAVATLFQQQLCIIDAHPYQNINSLGEPLALIDGTHIYENVDSINSLLKDTNLNTKNNVSKAVHHPRLDTPPSSGTDTEHSSEEYEAYEARYRKNIHGLSSLETNKSVTLPSIRHDGTNQCNLQNLVTLQEDEHIKRLLTELNKTKNGSNSTYKPRNNPAGSQDDINITYSPERSLVYLSDSDSDGEIQFRPEVVRTPSIARLKAMFEKNSVKIESPTTLQLRKEITRSHSQRVTRQKPAMTSSRFCSPVGKSDSFNVLDRGRPVVRQREKHAELSIQEDDNRLAFDYQKPELPLKQRHVAKSRAPQSNFYLNNRTANDPLNDPKVNFRSNEYTSTGTRKPPVLPRKKFIGGRSIHAENQSEADAENADPIDKRMLEDEAECFHGSGGSVFYGPCATDVAHKPQAPIPPVAESRPKNKSDRTNTVQKQVNESQVESPDLGLIKSVDEAPKKVRKGYEPIWVGPNHNMSASSCEPATECKRLKLIRESNYGRIAPKCKSEEKLLESSSPSRDAEYGRINFKASSEPPIVNKNHQISSSDNLSSSESSNSSSNISGNSSSRVPNLVIHSPASNHLSVLRTVTAEPEFDSAVAEIRNLIDELMFDSSKGTKEPVKRERCHSLDLLCPENGDAPEVRERRPSTDLLEDCQGNLVPVAGVSPKIALPQNRVTRSSSPVSESRSKRSVNSPEVTWAPSNWSEKLHEPNPAHLGSNLKKSKTNITRSVSARETKRPLVVKKSVDSKVCGLATMRPHNAPLVNSRVIYDDGYVTLAETASNPMRPPNIPPKSPNLQESSHQYATLKNQPEPKQNDGYRYRTLPQPPPPTSTTTRTRLEEHIYCLPTLPKYRPPPPPPQPRVTSNADLPTPPPSSEETSSSSSQSDARPEPLYSQVQRPKKDSSHFILPDNLISTGYGHVISKANFSYDDLDVSDKPVAPPRKGRKQQKYSRHSLLDLETQKTNWHEGQIEGENSSPQWLLHHHSIITDQDNECEDHAPNIPQKTAAAFQVPEDCADDIRSDVRPQAGPISDV